MRSLVSSSALHTPLVFRRSNIISACLSLIVRLSFWLWFRAERGRAQGQGARSKVQVQSSECSIEALIITYTVAGVPCSNSSVIYTPKPLFQLFRPLY